MCTAQWIRTVDLHKPAKAFHWNRQVDSQLKCKVEETFNPRKNTHTKVDIDWQDSMCSNETVMTCPTSLVRLHNRKRVEGTDHGINTFEWQANRLISIRWRRTKKRKREEMVMSIGLMESVHVWSPEFKKGVNARRAEDESFLSCRTRHFQQCDPNQSCFSNGQTCACIGCDTSPN